MTGQLVIVRHGQSKANLENVFAGWVDTHLTDKGRAQARAAGDILKKCHFKPDVVYASTLVRAIDTAKEVMAAMGVNLPITQREALLERHYGALTGMDKAQAKQTYGDDLFLNYRRSYDEPPPPMEQSHPAHPQGSGPKENRVIALPPNGQGAESLKDVVDRVRPFWENELLPRLKKGEKVLIAAHGNSLRALTMIIEGMTPDQIKQYEIDNGIPIGYNVTFPGGQWKVSPRRIGEELLKAS